MTSLRTRVRGLSTVFGLMMGSAAVDRTGWLLSWKLAAVIAVGVAAVFRWRNL